MSVKESQERKLPVIRNDLTPTIFVYWKETTSTVSASKEFLMTPVAAGEAGVRDGESAETVSH